MRRVLLIAAAAAALVAVPLAHAFFTAAATGQGQVTVATMSAPAVTASAAAGDVSVSWTPTDAPAAEVTYAVARSTATGWTTVCANATAGCTDTPGPGTYRYRVTASFRSWTSTGDSPDVTVAPAPALTSRPADPSANPSPQFAFAGAGTLSCRLDALAWTPCSASLTTAGLADGPHSFSVRDPSGPATRVDWTVDTSAPQLSLSANSATFSHPAYSRLECSADGAPWAKCVSPADLSGFSDGAHTLAVRGVDADGFPTAAVSRSWTTDRTPPTVGLPVVADGDVPITTLRRGLGYRVLVNASDANLASVQADLGDLGTVTLTPCAYLCTVGQTTYGYAGRLVVPASISTGDRSLTATAADLLGNLKASLGRIVSVTAATGPLFGFNDTAAGGSGQLTPTADAQLASQAGAQLTRVPFEWRNAEPTPGAWRWGTWDAIYNANIAAGIRPVFILTNAPSWAWAAGTTCTGDCHYPPGSTHIADWRNAVHQILARYPKLAGLEIWNEPNVSSFWQAPIDPAYYTSLLKAAYAEAKTMGSPVPVVGGAIAGYPQDDAKGQSYLTFLKGMYAAGAAGNMDALSIHAYPRDLDLYKTYKELNEVRDQRQIAGDTSQLWMTETGATTTGGSFTENEQANLLPYLLGRLRNEADLSVVMFHTLVDPPYFPANDSETGYGLIHLDLTPKPAYCTLAAMSASSYGCPSATAPAAGLTDQEKRWQAEDVLHAAADAARRYHRTTGTYVGLTSATLAALDPSLSLLAAPTSQTPGPGVDPTRLYVYVGGLAPNDWFLICNSSTADRSYCVSASYGGAWKYASYLGNINGAAGSAIKDAAPQW